MKRFFLVWAPIFVILVLGEDYLIAPVVRWFVPPADVGRISEMVMFALAFALGGVIMLWPRKRWTSQDGVVVAPWGAKASWMGIIALIIMTTVLVVGNEVFLTQLQEMQAPEWAFYLLGLVGVGGGALLILFVVERMGRK